MPFGYEAGEVCNRNRGRCKGVIALHEKGDCRCHLSPPCNACVESREYCPECGYEGKDDYIMNDYVVNEVKGVIQSYEPRKLDNAKIDFYSRSHSNSSMLMEGVYPEGMTREQVEEKVRGTFGGRFQSFGSGKFSYIAYTD